MRDYVLQFRAVRPNELLSEERVLQRDPDNPFLGPGDRPEPYRTLYIAAARLKPVCDTANVNPPLLVNTPRGRGLLWRWWPDSLGVVLVKQRGNDWILDQHVTFLDREEFSQVSIDFTQIVLNPPPW